MRITKINFNKFRQFENISIPIGKYVTCIAGHNGTGKSQILALLGNCGQLLSKEGTTLQDKAFRADWGEIIKGDYNYDAQLTDAFSISFDDLPKNNFQEESQKFVKKLSFRTTWVKKSISLKEAGSRLKDITKDNLRKPLEAELKKAKKKKNKNIDFPTRYRIIPKKQKDSRDSESKLNWPTYYLGMSRLYPSGESKSKIKISTNNRIKSYASKIEEAYKEIFDPLDEIEGVYSVDPHVSRKNGAGIKENDYGPLGNSNGQDDLTQILLAITSFEDLKNKLGSNFRGGILLIDELDAGLHTAAQRKLLDYIIKKSRKIGIQVVFTTHSLDLIQHYIRSQKKQQNKNDLILSYITNGRGKIEVKVNPTIQWVQNEITDTYNINTNNKHIQVIVLTEDDTANWFLKYVLYKHFNIKNLHLRFLDVSMGWQEIVKLIRNDDYFKNYITILDADVSNKNLGSQLSGSNFHVLEENTKVDEYTVLTFPKLLSDQDETEFYLEGELWNYIYNLPENHNFYYSDAIDKRGITKRSIIAEGPFKKYRKGNDESKIKAWFKDNKKIIISTLLPYFCQDHNDELVKFVNEIIDKYNIIVDNSFPNLMPIENIKEEGK